MKRSTSYRLCIGLFGLLGSLLFASPLWAADGTSSFASKLTDNAPPPEINQNPLTLLGASLKTDSPRPGDIVDLVIRFDLAPKHHAYLDQFKLEAVNETDIKILDFTVDPVVDFKDVVSKKIKEGTKGQGRLTAVIRIPKKRYGGDVDWKLNLTYQACTKDYCLFPKKVPVEAEFTIDGPDKPFDFRALFGGESGGTLFKKALAQGWLFAFFIVFLGGILTSFTPCIFPMIPITLAVLGTQKPGQTRLKNFSVAFTYVMGIALTYSLLGVIAASTGALFGALLGHPMVVLIISLTFVIMGVSMLGAFDLQPPKWLSDKLNNVRASGQYLGAFLSGLVAGIVASPCVGPVLAGVLLYVATSKDVVLGFFLLFTFALGMGLIFLVLGTFSHLKDKLPRSGPWMTGIKMAFGVIMLLMAAYFAYPVVNQHFTKQKLAALKE